MDTKRANEKIEYTLKRGMRKTILLRVTPECKVEVLAPRRISQAFIDGFVESKREWIQKCLEKKADLARQRAANGWANFPPCQAARAWSSQRKSA